jgi:hypothetical protein
MFQNFVERNQYFHVKEILEFNGNIVEFPCSVLFDIRLPRFQVIYCPVLTFSVDSPKERIPKVKTPY